MKKIAIFTEGQSDLIFTRNLLFQTLNFSKLSIECIALRRKNVSYSTLQYSSPDPAIHFLIVDVGNDTRVLSKINEVEKGYFKNGYIAIIGLRDMYSDEYKKRSPKRIIKTIISKQFINGHNEQIDSMSEPDRIRLFFAIMELEAWFIGMYTLFEKIDPILTPEYIEKKLGYNLQKIDPEETFFKPSNEIDEIFSLCGRKYSKSKSFIENIVSKIDAGVFQSGFSDNRCKSLKAFFDDLSAFQKFIPAD